MFYNLLIFSVYCGEKGYAFEFFADESLNKEFIVPVKLMGLFKITSVQKINFSIRSGITIGNKYIKWFENLTTWKKGISEFVNEMLTSLIYPIGGCKGSQTSFWIRKGQAVNRLELFTETRLHSA